ncbi:hypothetical protein [Salinarimonas ramus]|uniref:DUF1828 domain-containing protein n=1 Tax=Salinarimonas ramus TaxID=690164 RepID=A0A917Q4L3_9HYPH|nr:hypothetical protein [Salinarimonas ramus]GGK21164.1 hypothetical protein GCM10011322_04760 [Salinarimonas ramus]
MTISEPTTETFDAVVTRAAADLVRVRRERGGFLVGLPMVYADGSFVTVRVEPAPGHMFRVSDAGFAYRECEDLAGPRAFRRTAIRIADERDVDVGERMLSVVCGQEMLERAMWDVAETSWRVVDVVASRAFDEDEDDLAEELAQRLQSIFGTAQVQVAADLEGSSTLKWCLSALVRSDGAATAFQAVTTHPHSVNKASTAFRDIAAGERPPALVAVVRDKQLLGARLGLLVPARVIETTQSDEFYRRVAA